MSGGWGGGGGGRDIGCSVWNSANISVVDSTEVLLTFDSEDYDTDSMHSTSSNTDRITFTTAGKYVYGIAIDFSGVAAVGYRQVFFYKNAGAVAMPGLVRMPGISGDVTRLTAIAVANFAATDYIYIKVYQTSGLTLNVETHATAFPRFFAHKIDKGG